MAFKRVPSYKELKQAKIWLIYDTHCHLNDSIWIDCSNRSFRSSFWILFRIFLTTLQLKLNECWLWNTLAIEEFIGIDAVFNITLQKSFSTSNFMISSTNRRIQNFSCNNRKWLVLCGSVPFENISLWSMWGSLEVSSIF